MTNEKFIDAAAAGNIDQMASLLDSGRANIDAIDPKTRQTACHAAIVHIQTSALEWLVSRGANLSVHDESEYSILGLALMYYPFPAMASLLLDAGAPLVFERM